MLGIVVRIPASWGTFSCRYKGILCASDMGDNLLFQLTFPSLGCVVGRLKTIHYSIKETKAN